MVAWYALRRGWYEGAGDRVWKDVAEVVVGKEKMWLRATTGCGGGKMWYWLRCVCQGRVGGRGCGDVKGIGVGRLFCMSQRLWGA